MKQREQEKLVWREERRAFTLVGEPVLEMALTWPEYEGKGSLAQLVRRYYQRLTHCWKGHWEKELYLRACGALAQQRENSRPFTPWSAVLGGEVTLDGEEYLSIAMWAREVRGDGRTLEYRWGDTWRKGDGTPVFLKELCAGEKKWRRRLREELEKAAQESSKQGVFLDEGAEKQIYHLMSGDRFSLRDGGMEFYFPQCALAPAVEGAVALRIPYPLQPAGEKNA